MNSRFVHVIERLYENRLSGYSSPVKSSAPLRYKTCSSPIEFSLFFRSIYVQMIMETTLSEQIAARLKEYIDDPSHDGLNLRNLAARFEALPLCVDWENCWAIRLDGKVVVFLHSAEDGQLETEDDQRLVNIALYQGGITYPEIKSLVPLRPAESKDCPYCVGKGIDPNSLEDENIICYCGGLGWVPAAV